MAHRNNNKDNDMNTQLSFLDPVVARRKFIRDRNGRFATKQQKEILEAQRNATHYKRLYEAERRKLMPVLRRLIRAERELYNLKNRSV